MTCRKAIQISSKLGGVVSPGRVLMRSAYRLNGDRYRGGVNLIQAFVWNVGTCHPDVKRKARRKFIQKSESINAGYRDGLVRSSVDACESMLSKGITLVNQVKFPKMTGHILLSGYNSGRSKPWKQNLRRKLTLKS